MTKPNTILRAMRCRASVRITLCDYRMKGTIEKQGRALNTLEEWRVHAGPKRDIQWQDDRSAKESARSWLRHVGQIPDEISSTLFSHPDIDSFSVWKAEPESLVRFDDFRGEPANLDVLLVGEDDRGHIVVAVEAKADESFGSFLEDVLRDAEARSEANPRSKGIARIERILKALFGTSELSAETAKLRYQLMTASAAVIAEAARRSIDRAVVLVHEFVTVRTSDEKHQANANDLDQFVSTLAGKSLTVQPGTLVGPLNVPGDPITDEPVKLYFGKAVINKRNTVT